MRKFAQALIFTYDTNQNSILGIGEFRITLCRIRFSLAGPIKKSEEPIVFKLMGNILLRILKRGLYAGSSGGLQCRRKRLARNGRKKRQTE
jgi:hypothetical protein